MILKEKVFIYKNLIKSKTIKYKNINNIYSKSSMNMNGILKKNNIYISFLLLISFIYFFFPLSKQKTIRKLNSISEISLVINGTGDQKIFNNISQRVGTKYCQFSNISDKIIINGVLQNYTDYYVYNLRNQINNITLIWNYQPLDCSVMFSGLSNIIKIDLSKFDSSKVTDMRGMFNGCSSLTSINFNNFNTSSVTSMIAMFYSCSSLISLNLENFNISLITNLESMFYKCNSLISLNLDNFNTSSVTNMNNMFYECSSLISLDLNNFNTLSVTKANNIFSGCQNIMYCINETITSEKIISQIKSFNSSCLTICILYSNKNFIIEKNKCIDNCKNDDTYKYEYNNLCYFSCPNGTHSSSNNKYICLKDLECENDKYYNYNHTSCIDYIPEGYYLNDSEFITIDICDIKCKNCTLESTESNLCLSCNNKDNYYQKFNDSLNDNKFINCYNNIIDGYYLDNLVKMYKPCYYTCKKCNELGDENNNKCIEYYSYYILNDTNNFNNTNNSNNTNNINNLSVTDNFNDLSDTNNLDYLTDNYNTNYLTDVYYTNNLTDIYNTNYLSDTNNMNETNKTPNNIINNNNTNILTDINNNTNNSNIIINNFTNTTNNTNKFIYPNNYTNNFSNTNSKSEIIIENNFYNDKCIIKGIKNIINNFTLLNNISNINFYCYELNSDINIINHKDINSTFIDYSSEIINYLIKEFNLDKLKDKIYILIIDYPSNDSRTATYDYTYKFILENGTELNLKNLKEDIFINIFIPIYDLNLANFSYYLYFAEQGYDIYNKSNIFYNDICSPAYLYINDIIIKDRKKDIYPNNVTLCKDYCQYKKVNIEEKKIICECNLKENVNFYSDYNNHWIEEEDNNNFFSYILDNINYKIFKCYKLLLDIENLKENYAFYVILSILFIIIILSIYFFTNEMSKIRIIMFKEMPTKQKVKKYLSDNKLKSRGSILLNPIKKQKRITNRKNNNVALTIKKSSKEQKKNKNRIFKNKKELINSMKNSSNNNLINNININISARNIIINNNKKTINKIDRNKNNNNIINKLKSEDINKLPYTRAIYKDKRNFIEIFISIIIDKLEFINLFCGDEKLKTILFCQYIISLLIDYFFNTLLYSDDIVSHKYHNNGKLDFIVSFSLSLLSNLITSIISHFFNNSKEIEEKLQEILELNREYKYLRTTNKFLKLLKIKIIIFVIYEILIIFLCYYYIVIFFVIYNCSIISLTINYLYSLLHGFIASIIISFIIVITRKIGIIFLNRYFYNTSKFINDKL